MKKFNHTAHKELWDWLAKNPDKAKPEEQPAWRHCRSAKKRKRRTQEPYSAETARLGREVWV